MSKIALVPNISGTGVLTIEAPATNTDRTITLPDESGGLLTTNSPLPLANRNKIINGAMLVDQRNAGGAQTITAGAALAYTVDRFYAFCTGANITGQQVAGPIANTKRYRFTGLASNTAVNFGTRLEGVNTAMMAGKTASLSVKLRSSSLTSITWTASYANTLDTFGSVASPTKTQIATGTFTINASEATYETQISIPGAATTGIEILLSGGALLGTQTLTIGDVQLEIGEAATEFEDRDYGSELALCQRYFSKVSQHTIGFSTVAGQYLGQRVYFSVEKRTVPVLTLLSAFVSTLYTTGITTLHTNKESFSIYATTTTEAVPCEFGATYTATAEL